MTSPVLALARGHSEDLHQSYASDIVSASYAHSFPAAAVTTLPATAIRLAGDGMGKPVGLNIMAINMHANDRTAGCQVILVRKLLVNGTTYYILRLYGTLAITAGNYEIGTGKFAADTFAMTLSEEGTRIEAKTGVAHGDNDSADSPSLFNIPDLDNAYAVILDGACTGGSPSNAINFAHEFTT